ncbi:MAG: hypothetical protein IV107_13565 [Paucibacter sp.]|nr:hypothetical protein [Roseateles sp.]
MAATLEFRPLISSVPHSPFFIPFIPSILAQISCLLAQVSKREARTRPTIDARRSEGLMRISCLDGGDEKVSKTNKTSCDPLTVSIERLIAPT